MQFPDDKQPLNDQVSLEEVDLVVSRLAKMRGMSATKRLALATLSSLTGKPQGETIQPLIGVLGDPSLRKWKEREMAAWTLGRTSLNADEKDAAAATLMDVLESAANENIWRQLGRILAIDIVAAFAMILFWRMLNPWSFWGQPFSFVFFRFSIMFLPVTVPLCLLGQKSLNDRARIASAVALGNLAIPETVGALAGALRDRNRAIRVAS